MYKTVLYATYLAILGILFGCNLPPNNETKSGRQMTPGTLQLEKCVGDFDTAPELLSGEAPIYPITRIYKREGGFAVIEYTIEENGSPTNFKVIETSYKGFSDHAIIAIRQWKFKPATKNGVNVPVVVVQRMEFILH